MNVIGKHPGLNKGELKVLEWLEHGLSNREGTILVEPPLIRTKKNPYWPDFVIVSPTHGICILECKSFESAKICSISSVDELCTNEEVIRYKLQLRNYSYVVGRLLDGANLKVNTCVIFPLIAEIEQVAPVLRDFNQDAKDISLLFRDHMNCHASVNSLQKLCFTCAKS
jgi:hypothetical protein